MRMLQTYAPAIFLVILMRFRLPIRPTLLRDVCVCVFIHFQAHFQVNAFSMKPLSVLVWTAGLNEKKCMRFQTRTH